MISFFALALLWQKPKLEDDVWRPLPGGRAIASPAVQVLCGAVGVAFGSFVGVGVADGGTVPVGVGVGVGVAG